MAAIKSRVSAETYRRNHFRSPRGRGVWIFSPKGQEENPAAWFQAAGSATYTEALGQLAKACARVGDTTTRWVVMP